MYYKIYRSHAGPCNTQVSKCAFTMLCPVLSGDAEIPRGLAESWRRATFGHRSSKSSSPTSYIDVDHKNHHQISQAQEKSNIWSQIFNISIMVIIIINYRRSRREWDMNNIWAQMVFNSARHKLDRRLKAQSCSYWTQKWPTTKLKSANIVILGPAVQYFHLQ